MKRKSLAALLAAVTLCSALGAQIPSDRTSAAGSYDVDITVNTDGYRKAISPHIYGVNSMFREADYLYYADANSARQGGNRFSGYNWETNFSNAGRDWEHSSDQYLVDFNKELLAVPGAPALGFAREAAELEVPYKITTIQMAGYVAADDDGSVTEDQIAPSDRWIEVKARKGAEFSLTPDTTDGVVYMDEYVNYLVEHLGDAAAATGYQAYNLDNEPSLWDATHARMHPEPVTCEEIVSKSIEYASAIKDVDPLAEIFGLALYGVGAYYNFSDAPDWEEHADEYDWFVSYYLDEMAKAEQVHGRRLIDVIDLHYYSEAKGQCRVTECEDYTHTDCIAARMQSTRTLWDPMYMETSWIADNFPKFLPIFPSVQESIDTYYPGTKIALTEYNFGGGNHISGAVAEADALGVFAANGVYCANLWAINSSYEYQLSAIDLYTNYDGNGSAFGDTLVSSETSDLENATVYASIQGADESRLTMVLTNKNQTDVQKTTITLNSGAAYSSAKVYGITGDSSEIQLLQTIQNIENNRFSLEIPAMTVVQIELNAEDFTLKGDVNKDGSVDDFDISALTAHLLAKPESDISFGNSDLDGSGMLNAFDLAILKHRLNSWRTPVETPKLVATWPTKTGQWRIRNGMENQTLRLTFGGEAGRGLRLAYGYWDPVAINESTGKPGVWYNNDSTFLGTHTFDENGEVQILLPVPDHAQSVEIILFNYTETDASGTVVQLDKGEVTLKSVMVAE